MTPRQIGKYYRDLWKLKWSDRVWQARCAGATMDEPDWPEDDQGDAGTSSSADSEYEEFKRRYHEGKWRGHIPLGKGKLVGLSPNSVQSQVEGRIFGQ